MNEPISRRTAMRRLTVGAAAAVTFSSLAKSIAATEADPALKGRVNHSVCKWCYAKVPLEDLCREGKAMGLSSIELLEPEDFPTLKKHGLICAMVSFPTGKVGDVTVGGITHAFNRLEYHDTLVALYESHLKATADAGYPNLICFSGNREGMADEQGMENCVVGLKRILPLAEKLGVTVCMELLNSRVNHPDYMCDHSAWGVELCRRVGSERFKLLYDIYHMQIMEGDVIATIRQNHQYFAHYHTGGVPGRHEIDDTQELYYPAVMRAIVDTGFKGHVAQEFIPARPDVIASLRQGVRICDV
ncbi:MAG TPA: TIM barrel protein [Candidatus Didemnitutus sp.]|nr:TIM barrel protein [Candidatus Didemnitutus sp.]